MKIKRKSQVDVALTIGAIIIPVVALFGSLIFAFVMISQYADAGKLAAVISYDTITLTDIAYSVPDTIKIYYQPPSSCEFINTTIGGKKTILTCLNGFMNLSGPFSLRIVAHSAQIYGGCADVPFSVETYIPATIPADRVVDDQGTPITQPFYVAYPGYSNMKDQAVVMGGDSGLINIDVNNAIIVQKIRKGTFDTLDPDSSIQNDPLYLLISHTLTVCEKQINRTSLPIIIPHNYNLNVSGTVIYLTRFAQSPLNILSNSPNYTSWSVIYSFDLKKLESGHNCTIILNSTFNSSLIDFTKPKGNSFMVETTGTCTEDSDNNPNNGCRDSNGNQTMFNTITRLIVKPIGGT
jgi:hypothetical protein